MTTLLRVTALALLGLGLVQGAATWAADSSEVVKINAKADKPAADGTQVVTITIDIDKSGPSIQGLPEWMEFRRGHRPWITELVEQADRRRKK